MSVSGSNTTTLASYFFPLTSTCGELTPATTCAFVITRCGAYTNPLPSRPREQLATPVTSAIREYAERTGCCRAIALSGGCVSRIRSGTNGSRKRGNRSVLTTSLNDCSARSALLRRNSSPFASTCDPRTADVTLGIRAPLTATPSTQDTISTDTAASAAPPSASRNRTGFQDSVFRIREPTTAPSVRPIEASSTTRTSAAKDTDTLGEKLSSTLGTPQMPTAAPARSPTVAHAPSTNPSMYPEIATSAVTISNAQSSLLTPHLPARGLLTGRGRARWRSAAARPRAVAPRSARPPRPVGRATVRRPRGPSLGTTLRARAVCPAGRP